MDAMLSYRLSQVTAAAAALRGRAACFSMAEMPHAGAGVHHQRRGGERRRIVQHGHHPRSRSMRFCQHGDQQSRQHGRAYEHQE
jgi:hypothetical protein